MMSDCWILDAAEEKEGRPHAWPVASHLLTLVLHCTLSLLSAETSTLLQVFLDQVL